MKNSDEATRTSTITEAINDRHSPEAASWSTWLRQPAVPLTMITLLRDDRTGEPNDLDPVLGVATSLLASLSLYAAIGALITYFVMR